MADYLREAVSELKMIAKELEAIRKELQQIRRQMPKAASNIEVNIAEAEDVIPLGGLKAALIKRVEEDEHIGA